MTEQKREIQNCINKRNTSAFIDGAKPITESVFDTNPYATLMLSYDEWDDAECVFQQMIFDVRGDGING